MEEQFSLAKSIPSEDRENYTEETFGSLAYSFGGRISANLSNYISFDPKTKFLPSAIKNYYENYNGDEKDGQHKN